MMPNGRHPNHPQFQREVRTRTRELMCSHMELCSLTSSTGTQIRSGLTILLIFEFVAMSRGEFPKLFLAVTLAPCCKSLLTTFMWPALHAKCSGRFSYSPAVSMRAPWSNSKETQASSPLKAWRKRLNMVNFCFVFQLL